MFVNIAMRGTGRMGGEEALLQTYKKKITQEFFPRSGPEGVHLSLVRGVVMKFMKLSKNPSLCADIMLHYVEVGVKFTNAYGDIDESFYRSMESMAEKAAAYIRMHHREADFVGRFERVVQATSGIGWGIHETLSDIYREYFVDRARADTSSQRA